MGVSLPAFSGWLCEFEKFETLALELDLHLSQAGGSDAGFGHAPTLELLQSIAVPAGPDYGASPYRRGNSPQLHQSVAALIHPTSHLMVP